MWNLITGLILASTATAYNDEQQNGSIRTLPLIPYYTQRRRRNLNSRELTAPQIVEGRSSPLYQGLGTHYVDLWIGNPPQRQTVIIDTGSGVTAVPCSGCADCGSGYHADHFFMEEDSTTFKEVTCDRCHSRCNDGVCQLSVHYQEGSGWNAREVTDDIYIGGPHEVPLDHPPEDAFTLTFGCQNEITGLFKTQLADGIMGMDFGSLSFWKQAYNQSKIPCQAFSLCFSHRIIVNKEDGLSAGVMTLGGNNPALHTNTNMVFANFVVSSNFYRVQMKKVYLRTKGGQSVEATGSDFEITQLDIDQTQLMGQFVIVDSGTTSTYLSGSIATPFKAAWKEVTGLDWNSNREFSLTVEQLNDLPTILIQFHAWQGGEQNSAVQGLAGTIDPANPNDALVAMRPTHYLTFLKEGTYAPAISFEGKRGILGANFMAGHDIYFDADNKRMGFAESTCDYATVSEAETAG